MVFLGIGLSTASELGLFVMQDEYIVRIRKMAAAILGHCVRNKMWVSSRWVASLLGVAISQWVCWPGARRRTRGLQNDLNASGFYTGNRGGDTKVKKHGLFNLKYLSNLKREQLGRSTVWRGEITKVVASDASKEVHGDEQPGWAAVLMPHQRGMEDPLEQVKLLAQSGRYEPMAWPHTKVVYGVWKRAELLLTIQTLEMRAVKNGTVASTGFGEELRDSMTLWLEDN